MMQNVTIIEHVATQNVTTFAAECNIDPKISCLVMRKKTQSYTVNIYLKALRWKTKFSQPFDKDIVETV